MSYTIEEDRETYTGTVHPNNGYYAGDLHDRPVVAADLRYVSRFAASLPSASMGAGAAHGSVWP
jgi:hypothetical protein